MINELEFKVNNVCFKIIATESFGKGIENTEDTIINLETRKIKKIMRLDLLKYLK